MERFLKAYEVYIRTPRGQKGKVLKELARKFGVSEAKLRRIFRSIRGETHRKFRSPLRNYRKDDILYAIHYSRTKGVSLLYACNYLVRTKKVLRLSYEEVKDPARAFYLSVVRFIKSSNSNLPKAKNFSKKRIKEMLLRSDNFTDVEKLIISLAVDGILDKDTVLNETQEKALNSLLKKGFLSLRKGKVYITAKLKYDVFGDEISQRG